jgi:hypothetical protein
VDFSVYRGSCGSTTLECIAGVASPCSSLTFNRFTFITDVGVTYYMLLRSSIFISAFDLLISNVPAPASGNVNANDLCPNAAPIAIGSTVAGNMSLATTDENEVPGDCLAGKPFGGRRGLWYTFDGTGGLVIANTCSLASIDTYISVYKGRCGASTLQCVAGTEGSCTLPKFSFATEIGTKYYMLVRSASTSTSPSNVYFDLTTYIEGKSVVPQPPKKAPSVPPPTGPKAPATPTIPAPSAPTIAAPQAPTAPKKKCGLLGLGLFCPLTRCGVLGRLFGLCKE